LTDASPRGHLSGPPVRIEITIRTPPPEVVSTMHRVALLLLLALASHGCERGIPTSGSEPTISEDQFVEAMVELRTATFRGEFEELSVPERDEILRRRGLEPDDLVRFAEVHGPNVPLMFEVWSRVDSLALAASAPTPGADEPGGAAPTDGTER